MNTIITYIYVFLKLVIENEILKHFKKQIYINAK